MINEIKKYEELIEVDITDFNGKLETLYWEGELSVFGEKYQTLKAIAFPIHGGRILDVNRIQGFKEAKNEEKTLQLKICTLSNVEQENIKMKVNKYKKDFNKYPSDIWIDNVIENIVNPDKEELEWERKIRDGKVIQNKKIKRLKFYNNLSMGTREVIENTIFKKLENKGHSYILFKSLFILEKSKIIDGMMLET